MLDADSDIYDQGHPQEIEGSGSVGSAAIMSTEFTNPLRKFKLVFLGEQSGRCTAASPQPLLRLPLLAVNMCLEKFCWH